MMNRSFLVVSSFLLFSLYPASGGAQVITSNDGFEGTPVMGIPPIGWNNCDDGKSTVDTQPGYFNDHLAASEGRTYVSLVTRGVGTPGTVETVWSELLLTFLKGKCYTFTVDLSASTEFFGSYGWDDYYFNSPCVLQLFGFSGDCSTPQDSEMLWQSPVLSNYSWKTFDVTVDPKVTYQYIAFRPFFTPPSNYQNSVVYIDNLKYKITTGVFVYEDGIISIPEGSTGISWYYNHQIIPGNDSTQQPVLGSGLYTATFYGRNGCYVITEDYIDVLNNILLFPNPAGDEAILQFFSSEESSCEIELYDVIGRKLIQKEIPITVGMNKIPLNLISFAPASYILVVKRKDIDKKLFKLIKE
jgi:hypothetical protein